MTEAIGASDLDGVHEHVRRVAGDAIDLAGAQPPDGSQDDELEGFYQRLFGSAKYVEGRRVGIQKVVDKTVGNVNATLSDFDQRDDDSRGVVTGLAKVLEGLVDGTLAANLTRAEGDTWAEPVLADGASTGVADAAPAEPGGEPPAPQSTPADPSHTAIG